MTSLPQREYTVESYNTDPEGRPQQSDVQKVSATSPEAAAMKVSNEDLHTHRQCAASTSSRYPREHLRRR